jgi:hypothetical protein
LRTATVAGFQVNLQDFYRKTLENAKSFLESYLKNQFSEVSSNLVRICIPFFKSVKEYCKLPMTWELQKIVENLQD